MNEVLQAYLTWLDTPGQNLDMLGRLCLLAGMDGGWWLFTYVFVEMTNKMEVVCFRVTITSSTDFKKDCLIGKTTVSGSQTLYCNTQWKCLGEVT